MKRNTTRRVTMADLARKTGFSKSTISRALAGDSRVRPETRHIVESLAAELGYQLHPMASGLARNRTHTIGLAIPSPPRSFSNPFYLEFVGGVGDWALTQGYTLFFAGNDDIFGDSGGQRSAVSAMADGYILTEPVVGDPRVSVLLQRKKPFVFLGSVMPGPGNEWTESEVIWTEADNVQGSRDVVAHLAQLGHKHIACIAGTEGHVASRNRLLGYEEALAQHDLHVDRGLIVEGDFTERGGYEATLRLMAGAPHATAIFAANDLMALGAIRALREQGKGIPRDVSVAGFDGIHLAQYVHPRLTTAAQPIYNLGEAAARLLIDQINNKRIDPKHKLFTCQLRVGDSTAAPRANDGTHG